MISFQEYVQELEARLQAYEANAIERNVALQQVSQKLKLENDKLKDENLQLRKQLNDFNKQPNNNSSSSNPTTGTKRKFKEEQSAMIDQHQSTHHPQVSSSTPSNTSRRMSNISTSNFISDLPVNDEFDEFFKCGFCTDETPCVCRDITSSQQQSQQSQPQQIQHSSSPKKESSILDNLPSYKPPVPLRNKRSSNSKKLFKVQTECSGDPDNCMACQQDNTLACRDDKPGRTFFEALQGSVCQDSKEGCQKCSNKNHKHNSNENSNISNERPSSSSNQSQTPNSIPASDAWRRLKSHPNIGLADLALLADVVASRTRCSGTELHQQVEAVLESVPAEAEVKVEVDDQLPVQNQHHYDDQEHQKHPPRLVPQDQLLLSSKRRKLLVEMGAVRDALDVLDRFSN